METSSESQQTINKLGTKDLVKLVLKFSLVGVIFWLLFRNGLVSAESFRKVFANPFVLLFNFFLIALNLIFSTYRWKLLLHCHKADLTYKETLRYTIIGCFFNIALPGAVSGDVVKAIYVASRFKEKRGSIFGSILFDRLLGVSALVMVAAISAVVSQHVPWGGELPRTLLYSIYALGLGVLGFFFYLFVSHHKDPVLQFFKRLTRLHPKLGSLERVYMGVMHYRHHFSEVWRAMGVSLIVHFFIVTIAFMLANTLSPQPLPFVGLSVVVPIGMLATAVPVLPAGVGTGHAAFYGLFHLLGSPIGAEVFSWIVFLQVAVGIVGGLVYLRTKME